MPDIHPFRGVTYDLRRVPDLGAVLAPPEEQYDREQARVFLGRHEHNIVRLTGLRHALEPGLNPRERARQLLTQWLRDGILTADAQPSIYAYHQDYLVGHTEQRVRRGFLAAVAAAPYSAATVMPAQRTTPAQVDDARHIRAATGHEFTPSTWVYHDDTRAVETLLAPLCAGTPDFRLIDDASVLHMLWRVTSADVISSARAAMAKHPCLLVDGMHRHEAALPAAGAAPAKPELSFGYFVNAAASEQLSLLPVHRLLRNLPDYTLDDFLRRAGEHFHVSRYAGGDREDFLEDLRFESVDGPVIGWIDAARGECALLRLKSPRPAAVQIPGYAPSARLPDAVLLEHWVLPRLLRVTARERMECEYEPRANRVFERATTESWQGAALINAPTVAALWQQARAGQPLPAQSVEWFPHPIAGLVAMPCAGAR